MHYKAYYWLLFSLFSCREVFTSVVGSTIYYAQVLFFHQSFQVFPSLCDGFFVVLYVVSIFCIKMTKYNYLLVVLFPNVNLVWDSFIPFLSSLFGVTFSWGPYMTPIFLGPYMTLGHMWPYMTLGHIWIQAIHDHIGL